MTAARTYMIAAHGTIMLLGAVACLMLAVFLAHDFFFTPTYPMQNTTSAQDVQRELLQATNRVALLTGQLAHLRDTIGNTIGRSPQDSLVQSAEVHCPGDEFELRVRTGVEALWGETAAPVFGGCLPGTRKGLKADLTAALVDLSPGLHCRIQDLGCKGIPSTGSIRYRTYGYGRSAIAPSEEIAVRLQVRIAQDSSLVGRVLAGSLCGNGTTTAMSDLGRFVTEPFAFSKGFAVLVFPPGAHSLTELEKELAWWKKELTQDSLTVQGEIAPGWRHLDGMLWMTWLGIVFFLLVCCLGLTMAGRERIIEVLKGTSRSS